MYDNTVNKLACTNPCKECNKRTISCHAKCKEYIEWKEYLNELNRKRRNAVVDWKKGYYHK